MNVTQNLLRGRLAALFVTRSGMWFRHNAANAGISLHRNKPRCGVLSQAFRPCALPSILLATVLSGVPRSSCDAIE